MKTVFFETKIMENFLDTITSELTINDDLNQDQEKPLSTEDKLQIVKTAEDMIKGICFDVVVKGRNKEVIERHPIDIYPEDVQLHEDFDEDHETLYEKVCRVAILQKKHVELFSRVRAKMRQLEQKYKKKPGHKVVMVKKISNLLTKKTQIRRYSQATTIGIEFRRSSDSDDSDDSDDNYNSDVSDDSDDSDGHDDSDDSDDSWDLNYSPDSDDSDESVESDYSDASYESDTSDRPALSPCAKYMILGPYGTKISRSDYDKLFENRNAAWNTRKLLEIIFGEEVLARSSVSGNKSPGFLGMERPPRIPLDAKKVADITYLISLKCKVYPQIVRHAITLKCADAARKFRG